MSEQNFEAMRRAMVESQLRTTGVNDPRVVAVMAEVPRERFVPEDRRPLAYMDRPVALGHGRELNLPEATGLLLTAAQVGKKDHVLVVGAATGYAATLLRKLAGSVVALEENAELAKIARGLLPDVEVVEGPLSQGWPAGAPYDLIFVDGRIEQVPDALIDQLADGGRLAAAVHDKGATRLGLGRKSGPGFGMDLFADCEASPLPGFAKPKTFAF